jgi:transposase-like protein
MAKLTEPQARAILHSKASTANLAREYGVSQSLIRQIRRRVIWAHID